MKDDNKKALFLFFGENTFLLESEIKRWRTEFEKKHSGDINITILETGEEEITAQQIQNAIESMPFLAEKRLVIVKNIFQNGTSKELEKITRLLQELPETAVLVFYEESPPDRRTMLFRKIKEIGELKEFSLFSQNEVQRWVMNQALKRNVRMTPQSAFQLLDRAGDDLWTLDNELQKLASYCKNRAVTPEDIQELVQPNLSTSIFKMTDALSEKNAQKAVELFHILVESGEMIRGIFSMIVRHFRILLLLADLRDNGTKSNEVFGAMKKYDTKVHPYAISIATKQVQKWKLEELKKIYSALAQMDIEMKTGEIQETEGDKRDMMLALEKFILWSTKM